MLARTWSDYQNRIYRFVAATPAELAAEFNDKRNAIVVAVAGSGKSSTVEESVKRIPRGLSHIVLAFNKAIADEMSKRGVNGRTFHSLTYSAVMRHMRVKDVEQNKLRILCDEHMGDTEIELYGSFICRLVSLGRNAGLGAIEHATAEAWRALVEHHDLELDSEHAKIDRALVLADELLEWSNESRMVDYDDMLYIAVRDGLVLPKFDFVFVDEAQDTNAIRRAILRKIMHRTTRIIAVGDPSQAIYGFQGADSNSMMLIADEFDAIELPLTVSYRCPTSVVTYAQRWVSHIEAAPGAAEGKVTNLSTSWNAYVFTAGDLVVCRTTKPLVKLAYQLIKARVSARIMGKDIGKGLVSLVRKMNAKGIDRLVDKLAIYTSREVEKCIAKKQETKAEAIRDKTDCIICIIESLDENNRTIPELILSIDDLFSDNAASVTLATIHKAKGLEAGRVFWLNSSQCPSPWARQEWQQQQERNLCYVAVTRAKSELVMIEERTDREAA